MNKASYVLTAFALILFVLIGFRVDNRIFTLSLSREQIKSEAKQAMKASQEARSTLEAVYAVAEDPKQYVLVDPVLELQEQQQQAAGGGPVVEMDSLRVMGAMTADGVWSAVVNGSVVGAGDSVRGCEVIEVDKNGVVFLIDGKNVLVPVYEEYQFKMVKTDQLMLEAVVSDAGSNMAVINGRTYKAGDWIDGETQVKAIAPTVVMLVINGQNKMLKVGQTL